MTVGAKNISSFNNPPAIGLGIHELRDAVLRETAERFINVVRASDSVARVGADEFVIVLSGLVDEETAMRLGDRLIQSMGERTQFCNERMFAAANLADHTSFQ